MAARSLSLLIIGHVWPEPSVSAAGIRMLQLLDSFREAGYVLHFGSAAEPTPHSADLESMGVQTHALPLNMQESSDRIKELQPVIVLFDRYMTEEQFGWRVQEEAPQALRILNTEDLHSLRHARQMAMEEGVECDLAYWLRQDLSLRELSSILRSDLSLMISETECEWLSGTGIIAKELVLYLPFMLENIKYSKTNSYKSFEERSGFCFVGFGKHAPNADAVRLLIRTIWPLIRKEIPDSELRIYGKDYPADIQALHNPEKGIFVESWVANMNDLLGQTRVNLAPLRFGAGLKGKIVHATEQGTPTIMSTIATEGLFPSAGFEALIADDTDQFTTKAVALYRNESLWQQAVQKGQAYLAEEMDREKHHKRLHMRIDGLLKGLETHRARHILGRILRHNFHQSSRYMAKWIEAKNRA